jgi:hypothetical protein
MGDEARACVVCGRVLEQILGEPRVYRHAAVDEPADHLPVAARPEDMPSQIRYRCDFCLDEPITHTLVVDKELGIPELNVTWDMEWALCGPCAELALADNWLDLRRRAFLGVERRFGRMSETGKDQMRLVYRDLREHLVMFYQELPKS